MNISRSFLPLAACAAVIGFAPACSKNTTAAQVSVTPTPAVATSAASPTTALPAASTPVAGAPAGSSPAVTGSNAQAPAGPAQPTQVPAVSVIPAPSTPIAVESHADQAAAAWAPIKDLTFDQRSAFIAGANRMASILDGQVGELDAKRASFAPTVDTKNWDFAMHDLRESQSYFKSMVNEVAGATSDTWQQEKDKLEAAWEKAQAAFDAVKTTVTAG